MLKKISLLYCITLLVMGCLIIFSLYFKWYDSSFELVISKSILEIFLNNIGVFGKIVMLSIISFGFLGSILIMSNLLILAVNVSGILAIYGLKKFLLVMCYGLFELSYLPVSMYLIIQIVDIFLDIYKNKSLSIKYFFKFSGQVKNFIRVLIIEMFILMFASVLEFYIGEWL
ncbi:hypothetical protein [Ligilactobacillus faecis]|uniref:hypothetical protein n=1 Tax=Ligilactobacillus faecis TaxID=762833 RepID=UPI0024688A0E|nr:hypothetical protein [Ligilactobacillus faecis]WGN90317.1 hypothetical protein QFX10_04435 [Ligilactobacillus faecis]